MSAATTIRRARNAKGHPDTSKVGVALHHIGCPYHRDDPRTDVWLDGYQAALGWARLQVSA